MKKLINDMIESGHLSREDECRFDALDAIFDYIYTQVLVNEPWDLILPISREGITQDVWYDAVTPDGSNVTRAQYDNQYAFSAELLKYVRAGRLTSPEKGGYYSVSQMLTEAIDDIVFDTKEDYAPYQPSPEDYCIVLSHVLAKIVTDNVRVQGAVMLYFHGQFIRLGLIDAPQLTC